MITAALLPLIAVLPIAAAALAVLVRHRTVQRVLLIGIPVLTALAAVDLLRTHASTPVLADNVGGFVPGIAIPIVSDTLSALMLLVTSVTALACVLFMMTTGEDRYRLVPPLVLMMLGGVNGAVLTGDLFNLFVFIEVMLLPSYALIAVTGTWRRLGWGRSFIIINLLTSTMLLIGVGLVYATAGTVNLAVLAGVALEDPRTAVSTAIVLVALSVKAAVVPVHTWLPRAYPATSASVMALFSAVHTKVAVYALYRIVATVYEGDPPWRLIFAVLVGLSIIVGAYGSFGERILRRALSWQMIAGIGHILLGLVIFTELSLAAGIYYLLHHVVTLAALLMVIAGVFLLVTGAVEILLEQRDAVVDVVDRDDVGRSRPEVQHRREVGAGDALVRALPEMVVRDQERADGPAHCGSRLLDAVAEDLAGTHHRDRRAARAGRLRAVVPHLQLGRRPRYAPRRLRRRPPCVLRAARRRLQPCGLQEVRLAARCCSRSRHRHLAAAADALRLLLPPGRPLQPGVPGLQQRRDLLDVLHAPQAPS